MVTAGAGQSCEHRGMQDEEATEPGDEERETAYELLQRGQALLRRRHNAQAAVVLERAAALEPGRGSILEALGRAVYNAGNHRRALEVFEALLDVDPSSAYGHFALAQSLRKVGRGLEAVVHLRLACALEPASTLYRGALARAVAGLDSASRD
jgi:tetratricopeptide (TPR) repeat protein